MNNTPSWTDVAGALGAITAAVLGVGGVIWAVVRGFFLLEKRLGTIETVFHKMEAKLDGILKNTEDTLEQHARRLDAQDYLFKDIDRRLSTIEGKMEERASYGDGGGNGHGSGR